MAIMIKDKDAKKIAIVAAITLIAAFTAVSFTACDGMLADKLRDYFGADANITDAERAAIYEIEAIALNEDGGSLLFYTLMGINSSLVSVNTKNAELTALDGTVITAGDFMTGQLVNISYDGMIAESYPGQIFNCYSIQITGDADTVDTADALNDYISIHTVDSAVYYVDAAGTLASKNVSVTYGDYFGKWKEENGVPDEVKLLHIYAEDNAYEETNSDKVTYYPATARDYHLDISAEFLVYLSSVKNEEAVVDSLVKTIIGDNPPAPDTAVFLTVGGDPLITKNNDYSSRLN